MNARTCMACGSEAGEDATRCTACGRELEPRLFHESSDVRLEAERLGEAVPAQEASLPAGAWGRASEHPHERTSEPRPPEPEAPSLAAAEPEPLAAEAKPAPAEPNIVCQVSGA